MRTKKRREEKILPTQKTIIVKAITGKVKLLQQPTEIAITTSASNIAGGTINIERASELVSQIPGEQLDHFGISELPRRINAVCRELRSMRKEFRGYFGYAERALGDLLPEIVQEYYENEGYGIKKVDENTDKEFKIDLIAEKNNEIRAIQVKKGAVSSQEIRETCEKAQIYLKQKISNQKVKIIDIVAQRFPSDYLQIRDEFMKSQKKITLTYTHFYHVIRKVPRYRYLRIGRPMSSNR